MTDHNVDINKMAPGTLRDQLDAISPEPHPMRDNFLEAALYQAWRAGKLIPADEVPALTAERDALKALADVLNDKLEIERALTDGAHRRARTAEADVERLKAQPVTVQDAARVVANAINNDMQTFNKALTSIMATPEMPVQHFFAEAILAYADALRAITEGRE